MYVASAKLFQSAALKFSCYTKIGSRTVTNSQRYLGDSYTSLRQITDSASLRLHESSNPYYIPSL